MKKISKSVFIYILHSFFGIWTKCIISHKNFWKTRDVCFNREPHSSLAMGQQENLLDDFPRWMLFGQLCIEGVQSGVGISGPLWGILKLHANSIKYAHSMKAVTIQEFQTLTTLNRKSIDTLILLTTIGIIGTSIIESQLFCFGS